MATRKTDKCKADSPLGNPPPGGPQRLLIGGRFQPRKNLAVVTSFGIGGLLRETALRPCKQLLLYFFAQAQKNRPAAVWLWGIIICFCVFLCIIIHMDSKTIIKRLQKEGWRKVGGKGDHEKFAHPKKPGHVVVPHPRKDMAIGTLKNIYRQAGWEWK